MILDDIVAARRESLAQARARVPLGDLERRPAYREPRRGFAARIAAARPAIIAEVKKASPSRGVIRADFDPVAIARAYAAAGATAVSVLTEEAFFQGRLEHLERIREQITLPLLRKDFLIDAYQVVEARAWGADAVLLIVAILDDSQLCDLLAAAHQAGLDALVEVHTQPQLERALRAGTTLIGINTRDLHTFVTTLTTAERLRPLVPPDVTAVAESGIESAADITRLRAVGFEAFLIGESLMRAPDPGAQLRALLQGLRAES